MGEGWIRGSNIISPESEIPCKEGRGSGVTAQASLSTPYDRSSVNLTLLVNKAHLCATARSWPLQNYRAKSLNFAQSTTSGSSYPF